MGRHRQNRDENDEDSQLVAPSELVYENRWKTAKSTGRPSILSEELTERICKLIAAGDRPEVAAGVCGVGRRTYFEWMKRGEDGEEPFASFRTEVLRAVDVFESSARAAVLDGDGAGVGFGAAKAALEVLARRMPLKWGARLKVELSDQLGKYLDVAESVLPHEYYVKLLEGISALERDDQDEPGDGAETLLQ